MYHACARETPSCKGLNQGIKAYHKCAREKNCKKSDRPKRNAQRNLRTVVNATALQNQRLKKVKPDNSKIKPKELLLKKEELRRNPEREFVVEFQKMYPKLIDNAVKRYNQNIEYAKQGYKRERDSIKKLNDELKLRRTKRKTKKNLARIDEILNDYDYGIPSHTRGLPKYKKDSSVKPITASQMKKKPWKFIMELNEIEDAGLARVFVSAFNPSARNARLFNKLDGVDIAKYYHQNPKKLYEALKKRV